MRLTYFVCLIQCLSLALASASAQELNFGGVNVGTAASVQTLTYNFSSATTLSAVNMLTTGASGLDYTDGGSSTCAAGTPYSAGQSCVVTVAFTPSAPGLRFGGVTLFAQGNNQPLMTWYLSGIGQSGAVTIDPGTQATIATLSSNGQGYGLVIDGAGNVYVVDYANSQVIELAAGTFTQSTVVASGLLNPTAVALDGAGNLYISDTGNSRVVVVPNEQSGLNSADMSTVSISGLGSPLGLATDGSGNLYVADGANGNVIEIPAGGGAPLTLASGLTNPTGVAVDATGNVYVASNNQVSEYPVGGGTPIPMGSGYNNPRCVAVDASGAVYVADSGNSQIVVVAPGGASQATLALTGMSSPQGVAVDAAGNVNVTDTGNVYEVNRTQAAALAFGNTYVGSTSAPQTLTVSDAGNQQLTVSSLAITTNFTQVLSGGTDCTSSTQLSSSGQCLIAVAFAPAISGTLTGTLTLTDDAFNNAASTQTVQLSGGGSQVAQTIMFPPIPNQTYGGAPYALNATASSGLPVSYAVTSGPAIVSGNILTITGAGSVTVQASQAGNAQYAPAAPVSQTFAVNPAATTVTWSAPAPIAYGIALSGTQLNATANVPGTFVYSPVAGTVLNAGSQTLSVSFTPTDSTDYNSSNGSVTLQVNPAATTVTWSAPAPIAYGIALSGTQLNATANVPGTFVYTPAAGTVLNAGSQTLSVSFTPTDSTDYNSSNGSVTLQVNPAATTVTWSAPAPITYGIALSGTQLNATVNVPGTFVYSPAAGTVLNAGSQTLSVQFTPSNGNYASSTGGVTLQVNQASQTITFPTIPTQTYGAGPVTLNATASSGLPVSYAVASGPATVGGNILTITGAGSVTVQASQAGNANYAPVTPVSQTFTVNQATQTITFTQNAPAAAPYNGSFTVAAAASSGLPVSLSSSGVCTNAGATFTMTNSTGTCTVTASQSGNANYLAAPTVTQTTTATKAAQTVTFTGAPATAPYQSTFTVVATSNSGITPTITVAGPCSIAGTTVTMTIGTGTCTTTAKWAGNNYYLAASVTQSTTAAKAAPTVTFTGAPATAPYQSTFTVAATSNSGVTPTITAAGPCSIGGTTVTITIGTGTCTTTAKWAANNYYLAASVTQSTTAAKAAPTVTFTGAPATAPYQSTFTVAATSNSGVTPTITVAGPCSIAGTTVTMTIGTGTCTTTAKWAANNYYLATSVTQTTTAQKLVGIITWPTPAAITYPTALSATQLDATANVAGGFMYSPTAGKVLTAGSQTLNVTFTPAQSQDYTTVTASVVLQVNQAKPIVTWPAPAAIIYGTPLSAKQLDATANVAGTFAYSPNAGTVVNAGSQTLSAQFTPSNSNYAPSIGSVTLQVNQASQTITFPPIPNQTYGAGPVTLNAFASSGLPVSYAVIFGSATVSGNILTTTGAGSVTVQASQAGNTNYAAATPVSQSFIVSATGQPNQFAHIVIVDQENRTPDNLFGSNPSFEPGVDIAINGINSQHQNVPFTSVALANCYDLGHTHAAFQQAYDNGAMDGSDKVSVGPSPGCVVGPNPQFRYVDNSSGTVQPYFDLATQYGFANRMFQTNQGPSFPSHQFLISGTSAPTNDSTLFAAENPNSAGCQSPPGTTVDMIAPNGVYSTMYPCFDHATLIDLLEGAGLTWRYYAADANSIWNGPNAISALCNAQVVNGNLTCTGSAWANVILNPAQVLTDVQNCNLANVAWVTPTGQNSDHAKGNTGGGPSWVASIVNAIGNSKCGYWQNTAILITWDDWGGWYDHVPPPQIGQSNGWGQSYVYGFRVPLLVVSASTPAGYVSNTNHDFGSLLRFAETNFGLGLIGPGTWADSYADDLMEFFPLSSPRGFNAIPAMYDADHFINSTEPATPPDDD